MIQILESADFFHKQMKLLLRAAKTIEYSVVALVMAFVVAVGASILCCSVIIKTTSYDVSLAGLSVPARIAVVADLHGKEYGMDNKRLINKVRAQGPDAIILLGDLFPSAPNEDDLPYVLSLTEKLQDIAQVYFAMGNHEQYYTKQYGGEWIEAVKNSGAIVLDEEWADVNINGNTIRMGGTMGHGYYFGRSVAAYEASPEYQVLSALEKSPYPAILLAHMPETVCLSFGKEVWHIDLVLSGHTHGGVIRIPGKGGLFAPMEGWWPDYDYGEIMLNKQMRIIITSGLSGHDNVPRIFNLPEICVIDLLTDDQ